MPTSRAIVLKTTVVRESDILLTALSQDSGKVQLLARGAKRSKKRFLGGIECFDCGHFEYSSKESQHTGTLQSFTRGLTWNHLGTSLSAMTSAGLCTECSELFCPLDDTSCSDLFKPLLTSLRAIDASSDVGEQISIAVFYVLRLLQFSGLDFAEELGQSTQVHSSKAHPPQEQSSHPWCREMLLQQTPILPHDAKCYREARSLLHYVEAQAMRAVHTKEAFLSFVRDVEAS